MLDPPLEQSRTICWIQRNKKPSMFCSSEAPSTLISLTKPESSYHPTTLMVSSMSCLLVKHYRGNLHSFSNVTNISRVQTYKTYRALNIEPFGKHKVILKTRRKPWSSGRALGSRSEGHGFNPRPMLDGSGVKAMPGSIPTPTCSGSFSPSSTTASSSEPEIASSPSLDE